MTGPRMTKEAFVEKWTTGVNERDTDVRARVAADLDAVIAEEREQATDRENMWHQAECKLQTAKADHDALLAEKQAVIADNAALLDEISGAMDSLESEISVEWRARWEWLQVLFDTPHPGDAMQRRMRELEAALAGKSVTQYDADKEEMARLREALGQATVHVDARGNMLRYIAFVLAGDEKVDAQLAADRICSERDRLRAALIQAIYNRSPYTEDATGDPIQDGLREYMTQQEVEALVAYTDGRQT